MGQDRAQPHLQRAQVHLQRRDHGPAARPPTDVVAAVRRGHRGRDRPGASRRGCSTASTACSAPAPARTRAPGSGSRSSPSWPTLHGGAATVQSVPGARQHVLGGDPLGYAHLPPSRSRRSGGTSRSSTRWPASWPRRAAGCARRVGRGQIRRRPAAAPERRAAARARRRRQRRHARLRRDAAVAEQYVVQTASDGVEALEIVRASAARPGAHRRDDAPARRVRADRARSHSDPLTMLVPVVMLSARAGEEGIIEGLRPGPTTTSSSRSAPASCSPGCAPTSSSTGCGGRAISSSAASSCSTRPSGWPRSAAGRSTSASGLMLASDQLLRMIAIGRGEFEELHYAALIERKVHPDDRGLVRATIAPRHRPTASRSRSSSGCSAAMPRAGRGCARPGEAVLDDRGLPAMLARLDPGHHPAPRGRAGDRRRGGRSRGGRSASTGSPTRCSGACCPRGGSTRTTSRSPPSTRPESRGRGSAATGTT